jgi:hypothetical protein
MKAFLILMLLSLTSSTPFLFAADTTAEAHATKALTDEEIDAVWKDLLRAKRRSMTSSPSAKRWPAGRNRRSSCSPALTAASARS